MRKVTLLFGSALVLVTFAAGALSACGSDDPAATPDGGTTPSSTTTTTTQPTGTTPAPDAATPDEKRLLVALQPVQVAIGDAALSAHEIERVLAEREGLQSTGVGGGVAIPHGSIEHLDHVVGAVLLCAQPIEFEAIDAAPVSIFFAVIGPKRSASEHLKTLARVSRLLRDDGFRDRLLGATSGRRAFELIAAEEGKAR